MGWFDRKTRTTVKSTAMRMLNDKAFKPSAQQAVAHWLYDTDPLSDMFDRPKLSHYLENYYANSLPVQYDKLTRFANKQGNYVFGTPSASVIKDPKQSLLKASYQKLGISPSQVTDSHVSGVNGVYVGLLQLQEMGFNSKDNSLTLDGEEWRLDRLVIDLEQKFYDNVITSKTKINAQGINLQVNLASNNKMKLYVSQQKEVEVEEAKEKEPKTKIQTIKETQIISLNIVDEGKDFIYITHIRNGEYQYHKEVLDTDADVVSTLNPQTVFGDYYPRIYLRVNRVDIIKHTDEQYKKHTLKALRKVNMPLDGLTKQMHKGIGEHYEDVRSLFMYMGARLTDVSDPNVAEYLYRYFDRLYDITQNKEFIQVIEDNICKQTLVISGIKKETKSGHYKKLKPKHFGGQYFEGSKGVYSGALGAIVGEIPSTLVIVKQENNYYIQFIIRDIRLIVDVAGFSATHIMGDENLVIPIDRALVKDLLPKEREVLLYKCLHIHIMLVNERKEKWWETNLFKAVIFAVGVAISIAFPPAGAGMTALIEAVAIASLKSLAFGFISSAVVNALVDSGVIDAKTGVILLALANVAYAGFGTGGFSLSNLTTAPNLMRIVNTSFDAYGKTLMIDTQVVQKRLNEFVLKDKERFGKLQEAQKLLDTGVFTPSQELLKPSYIPPVNLFDTPQLFYSRHTNYNVVGLSLSSVSNFVSLSLQDKTSLLNQTNTNTDTDIHIYL